MATEKIEKLDTEMIDLYRNQKKSCARVHKYGEIRCDICSSTDIVETSEGYTCRNCGIELEIQKMEYYRPYNDDILQHAVLGTTQIGYKRERLRNARSVKLEKLNRLHTIRNNKQTVLDRANIEISRIFTALKLPGAYKELVFKKFKKIRDGLHPGTKYRNPEKLVPIAIYFTLKLQNISVNETKLLEVSKIEKKEFNAFKLQIQNFIPKYAERNRKDYILQKILEISEHFRLGMPFYYQSKKILYKLWQGIKCTKDDVVAGLVASISALCSFKEGVNVNLICKRLGIRMSTIQSQVKKRIMDRLNITGFVSLVKSSDLLKEVLIKMDLLEPKKAESSKESSIKEDVKKLPDHIDSDGSPDILQVELGYAERIFNSVNDIDYYFYALRKFNKYRYYLRLKLYKSPQKFDFKESVENNYHNYIGSYDKKLFDIELLKLYAGKGPP